MVGGLPTMREFDEHSEVAAVTVAKRFEGWRNALAAAGYDASQTRVRYLDEDLKSELRRVASELGHCPTTTEFASRSLVSAQTVSQRLGGNWSAACASVGLVAPVAKHELPDMGGWNKGMRRFAISKDELSYLYEIEGLSAAAIALRLGTSRQSVLRALRDHGIAVKRLHYSMPRETTIETALYEELERRNIPFVRQQVVDGRYLVDALIMGSRIVIECDGEYWHSLPGSAERDARRDHYLESRGYVILRFPEAALKSDVRACGQVVADALIRRINKD